MITIEYTCKMVEGEPGPNFYWRGTPIDFLKLLSNLHILGCKDNIEISLGSISLISINDDYDIRIRSSMDGNILCKIDNRIIHMDLPSSVWRRLLVKFLQISFFPSHDYIEFEDLCLLEDANFIVSSEASE